MLLVASLLLLLIFFVFSLCQFDQYMSQHVSPWVYPVWDSLCLLDLIDYFLFRVGDIFNYNLFKIFLISFIFLLCSSEVISTVLCSSSLIFFFCFSYSAIDSFQSIVNFSNCVCQSLHVYSLILLGLCQLILAFSPFYFTFLTIFTIIILSYFSDSFPISSSLFGLLCFQFVPSFVQYFSAFSFLFFFFF